MSVDIIETLIAVLHPMLVCTILGYGSDKGMYPWYGQLKRPAFTPPDWVFPVVWLYLYGSMGYASYLVWLTGGDNQNALWIHAIQLIVNGTWSQTYFRLHLQGLGAIHMTFMWVLVLIMMKAYFSVNYYAGLLIVPYVLWMTFAVYICTSFWKLNKTKNE